MTEQNWDKWKGEEEEEEGHGSDEGWRGDTKGELNAKVPEWEWKVEGDKLIREKLTDKRSKRRERELLLTDLHSLRQRMEGSYGEMME